MKCGQRTSSSTVSQLPPGPLARLRGAREVILMAMTSRTVVCPVQMSSQEDCCAYRSALSLRSGILWASVPCVPIGTMIRA